MMCMFALILCCWLDFLSHHQLELHVKPLTIEDGLAALSNREFVVFVKTLNGTVVSLYPQLDTTVSDFKNMVSEAVGTEPDQIRLIFAGKQLDRGTLADYNVRNECMISFVLRLRYETVGSE